MMKTGSRIFLSKTSIGILPLVFLTSFNHERARENPNIIVILADDMGFSDIGCYGGEISTPNLDALAKDGMRFTQFYTPPRCGPARASLLTGLYPHQTGMGLANGNLGFPGYSGSLNKQCITIAEALKPAGYVSYMTGKWHIGDRRPNWPVDRGFDKYFGFIGGATSHWEALPGDVFAMDSLEWFPPKGDNAFYSTDAYTNQAIEYIHNHDQANPFFLYLSFTAPHWPLHAWPEDIQKYRGKYMVGWDIIREQRYKRMIEMGIIDKNWTLSPRPRNVTPWDSVQDKDVEDLRMAVYAAMIDRMDQNIGNLLKTLKETDQFDNTLILFLSDNGGCHVMVNRGKPGVPPGPIGGFWGYDIPWANVSNTPFTLYKQFAHEGGISTPLIAHWPREIKNSNSLTEQPGHIIDIMATCLDIAGLAYPETNNGNKLTPLEGKSLLPVFKGEVREGHELLFWEHVGNKAVRQGKWKLVENKSNGWELYDMVSDRTETNNLAEKYPNRVEDMKSIYEKWAEATDVLPYSIVQGARNRK